jgi:hypothetical protein
MRLARVLILAGVITHGVVCGCHSTPKQVHAPKWPEPSAEEHYDVVVRTAALGTTRDSLVNAIQKGTGSSRTVTTVDAQSSSPTAQQAADFILSGKLVVFRCPSSQVADALAQALWAAGASARVSK